MIRSPQGLVSLDNDILRTVAEEVNEAREHHQKNVPNRETFSHYIGLFNPTTIRRLVLPPEKDGNGTWIFPNPV